MTNLLIGKEMKLDEHNVEDSSYYIEKDMMLIENGM